MKFLFCSREPLVRELGAPRVIIELAEALQELDLQCKLIGPTEIYQDCDNVQKPYSECLRHYLRQHAAEYDVVDYGHEHLPYQRAEFNERTLFVARSVMLVHHFETYPIPIGKGWKSRIGRFIKGRSWRSATHERIAQARRTVSEADLVNVCNLNEVDELVHESIPSDKIVVIPFGMSKSRRSLFCTLSSTPPDQPVIAFVGTFDYRKGANEFPTIVQSICASVADVRFRLIGTKGMFKTAKEVLAHFPSTLTHRIDVIPTLSPEDIPDLLRSCSVGIFPSYLEGFPFGVLDMLAASVPVVAYDSPGPPMMLPSEYLVPRGDAKAMSDKVIALLRNRDDLHATRTWANQRSQQFNWSDIAQKTVETYSRYLKHRN